MNKQYINTFYHSVLVGILAAIVILVSGWLDIKAWVVFFAWANYFLHSCTIKKSIKMLLAFFIGIFIAFFGSYAIQYLNTIAPENTELYMTSFVVFWIATVLIFLEIFEDWGEFVPATFLGTVLYFASGVELKTMFSELFIPLVLGIAAGYTTIITRNELNKLLTK